MKRFWHTWLAVVVSTTMFGSANAQQNWNQPTRVGSYQSILARGGYGRGCNDCGNAAVYGGTLQGGLNGNYGYGGQAVNGAYDGNVNGGVVNGGVVNGSFDGMQSPAVNGGTFNGTVDGNMQGRAVNGANDGGSVNGSFDGMQGRAVDGMQSPSVDGGYAVDGMQGRAVNGGDVTYGGGYNGGPVVDNGGYIDYGHAGGSVGNYGGSVYDAPAYGGGVYGRSGGIVSRGGGSGVNTVIGARALYLTRDYEDGIRLTRDNTRGDILFSDANDLGNMAGLDFSMTRRKANGNGLEIRYWGLYPGTSDTNFVNGGTGMSTYHTSLSNVLVNGGAIDLETYYNDADSNRIYRDNDFHNLEINLLKNGGSYTTRSGRSATYELLGGFRWFEFDEDYRWAASYAAQPINQVFYDIDVDNTLLGFQLGGRSEICMSDRISLSMGTKAGLFNNRISHRQSITGVDGSTGYYTAAGVDDYDYMSTKNDLAFLGELDLGVIYRVSNKCRAVAGYRALGVTGVALAPNQIPRDFSNVDEIQRINSNSGLILGGGYAGLEFCY